MPTFSGVKTHGVNVRVPVVVEIVTNSYSRLALNPTEVSPAIASCWGLRHAVIVSRAEARNLTPAPPPAVICSGQANAKLLGIGEYSLSQISLEQIFNGFAAQQLEEQGRAVGIV